MKKLFNLIAIGGAITIAGCRGGGNTITQSPMEYLVHGVADVVVNQYQDTTFYFVPNVEYVSGPQESMTLAVSAAPDGVYPSPMSISGTPGFGGVISMHTIINTAGTYPVTITATTSTGSKTYSFNIIVNPTAAMVYDYTAPTTNITIPQYTYTITPLHIQGTYHSGHKETVTVTPSTTATGYYFDPGSFAAMPDFSTDINLRGAQLTTGTYPVTLNASSPSTGTITRTFNVTVTPSSDCSREVGFAGDYAWWLCRTTCASYTGTETNDQLRYTYLPGAGNTVTIDLPFASINAALNCSAQTLTTGAATGADFNVSAGTGSFTPRTIILNYSISGGATSSCTTTLTR